MTISATFQLCNSTVKSIISQQKKCERRISRPSCKRSKVRSSRVVGTCAPKASIGIYYTTGTCNTEKAARKIKEKFGIFAEDPTQIRAALPTDLATHDGIVLGVPSYLWDEFSPVSGLDFDSIMPPISNTQDDLKDVKVAIFALGDQVGYPDNFADAAGTLWEKLEARGATLVGKTPLDGYTFKRSLAVLPTEDMFCGLVLDNENQADLTEERIDAWVKQLKDEFGITEFRLA